MRAIDADKMKADLLTVDPQFETMIDWCISVLDAQPTIELERKKGKWIDICGNLRCSECNIEYPDLYPDYDETNFCPNCGAEMSI